MVSSIAEVSMLLKCKGHFNHENTSCMMWATIETCEQMHCMMWATIETCEQMQLKQLRQEVISTLKALHDVGYYRNF